jgi:hypothetical protein
MTARNGRHNGAWAKGLTYYRQLFEIRTPTLALDARQNLEPGHHPLQSYVTNESFVT